jgi:hypothetical protein
MRTQRRTSDKIQEEAALNQARGAVEKLRELHDSLLLAVFMRKTKQNSLFRDQQMMFILLFS